MVNYEQAFKRPFTDFKKLLIGILLSILPIVNFFAAGYQLRCASSALKKKFELPEWKDFGDLFFKGLMLFVISIIYFIPVIVLAILIILLAGSGVLTFFLSNDPLTTIPLVGTALILTIIAIVLAILISFIVPMAIMHYIEKNKFKNAFNFTSVFRKAFTGTYFTVWLLLTIYTLIISFLLTFIPYLGSAIASFITGVTFLTAIGEVYSTIK